MITPGTVKMTIEAIVLMSDPGVVKKLIAWVALAASAVMATVVTLTATAILDGTRHRFTSVNEFASPSPVEMRPTNKPPIPAPVLPSLVRQS